jgi:hypothetical protein
MLRVVSEESETRGSSTMPMRSVDCRRTTGRPAGADGISSGAPRDGGPGVRGTALKV